MFLNFIHYFARSNISSHLGYGSHTVCLKSPLNIQPVGQTMTKNHVKWNECFGKPAATCRQLMGSHKEPGEIEPKNNGPRKWPCHIEVVCQSEFNYHIQPKRKSVFLAKHSVIIQLKLKVSISNIIQLSDP